MNIKSPFEVYPAVFQVIAPSVMLLLGLTIAVLMDAYLNRKQRQVMLAVIATVFLLIVQNYVEYGLVVGQPRVQLRTCAAILGYCIRPLILALYLMIVHPAGKRKHVWALIGMNTAIYMTALFSHICFWIDGENHYHGGLLRYFCMIVSLILLGELLYLTLDKYREKRKQEMWLPLFVVLLILAGVLMDSDTDKSVQPLDYLTISVTISCACYYIWLHLQFVREHEQALQAEQRIQIMMTQIQPHFLYNTIATIRALCRRDAAKAGEVAELFGDYLRQNLDSLGTVGLIPFQKELEHTKIYTEIEMVRFENVRVIYDIQEDAFQVPPLTLQPLVENAIRHGVRVRDEGIVRVSAHRCDAGHEMVVEDNGIGFDVKALKSSDGTHIGIQNVRERIESLCGGSMHIESQPGVGTKIIITIPEMKEAQMERLS